VLSLIAQGMLARKLIENWPAWIVVNIISIVMYVYKNLYLDRAAERGVHRDVHPGLPALEPAAP
jgi:hypothetical protein